MSKVCRINNNQQLPAGYKRPRDQNRQMDLKQTGLICLKTDGSKLTRPDLIHVYRVWARLWTSKHQYRRSRFSPLKFTGLGNHFPTRLAMVLWHWIVVRNCSLNNSLRPQTKGWNLLPSNKCRSNVSVDLAFRFRSCNLHYSHCFISTRWWFRSLQTECHLVLSILPVHVRFQLSMFKFADSFFLKYSHIACSVWLVVDLFLIVSLNALL